MRNRDRARAALSDLQLAMNFDLPTGRDLRDAGIKQAIEHADRAEPSWSDRALGYFMEYAATHAEMTTEEVRQYAERCGLQTPTDRRAWGAVALRAMRTGIVRSGGYTKAKSPTVHAMTVTLWVRS